MIKMFNGMGGDYYNNGNTYAPFSSSSTPRPTKSNVELFIANSMQINVNSVKFTEVSEKPNIWKHSCVQTGVTILPERMLNFFGVANIAFVVCPMCSKITYYVER